MTETIKKRLTPLVGLAALLTGLPIFGACLAGCPVSLLRIPTGRAIRSARAVLLGGVPGVQHFEASRGRRTDPFIFPAAEGALPGYHAALFSMVGLAIGGCCRCLLGARMEALSRA